MAPEVIEHKPYDEKADVFSFAIVLWELLTCKVPYNEMTPLQVGPGWVGRYLCCCGCCGCGWARGGEEILMLLRVGAREGGRILLE